MYYQPYKNQMKDKLAALCDIYKKYIYEKIGEVTAPQYLQTEEHYRSVPETGWQDLQEGFVWGGEWQTMWIKADAVVPAEAEGKKLFVFPKTNAVETLFFIDGKPSGIFNSKNDFTGWNHSVQLLCENAKQADRIPLAFECYAGHFYFPENSPYVDYDNPGGAAGNDRFLRRYESIDLCLRDELVWQFVFDLKILLQLSRHLPDSNFLKGEAENALTEVFSAIVPYPKDYPRSVWRGGIEKALRVTGRVLSRKGQEGGNGRLGVIGHSHMDTAWLWPVEETVRKCARTYSNALRLMEQYPDYLFVQSSALHLDWMRKYYPDIFQNIKKRVKEGRYEPNGGVWVECDCNITSGEAMIRQFLKGQRFTRKHFGYTADVFWLPDTFGYSAAIPQIMLGCEIRYFCTTKIGWNECNRFPFDTFRWRGLDGSEVFTHFNITVYPPDVEQSLRVVNEIAHKNVYNERLDAFGYGDGGGGPTPAMLEDVKRMKNLPGLPEVYYTTVSDFMKRAKERALEPPLYSGELYLEGHRGTLTQMHQTKRNNRKAERALLDLEYLNVVSRKPKLLRLEEYYEVLLLNQFHDILPGTSINRVTDRSDREMATLLADTGRDIQEITREFTVPRENCFTGFNPLSFDRNDYILLPTDRYAQEYPSQKVIDWNGNKALYVDAGTVGAYSAVSIFLTDQAKSAPSAFSFTRDRLQTPFSIITFDENGFIASLIDRGTGRELRKKDAAPLNTFFFADDVPQKYDNWDINYDLRYKYQDCAKLTERTVAADGPLVFILRSQYQISGGCSLIQDMIFYQNTPQIDFHTRIDWKEKRKLLKVGFDLDITASEVNCEIQFGHIARPTTSNDSKEAAMFEVCNHKWSDLSESRFGAALLNDCKYGISVKEGNLALTLHKGGCHPDTRGDHGLHEMTYSLLCHPGKMDVNNVIRPSYLLNCPYITAAGALHAAPFRPAVLFADNIICEAVKPAEAEENAYVLRLYEAERNKTLCELQLPPHVARAYLTNMLEDIQEEIPLEDNRCALWFRPFEIKTVLVKLK